MTRVARIWSSIKPCWCSRWKNVRWGTKRSRGIERGRGHDLRRSNRELRRRKHLLQHHERAYLPHTGQMKQLFGVELVEAFAVARAQEHEVVELAGHDMAFHAPGHFHGRLLEVRERVRCRPVEHDADDDQHARVKRAWIEQRDDACDQPHLLESLDATKASRR